MKFVGLDLSLASTGYTCIMPDGTITAHGVIRTSKKDSDYDLNRFRSIAHRVVSETDVRGGDIVCIENYAVMAGRGNVITRQAELGGIVKYNLLLCRVPVQNVLLCAPATLKKYVTGKGNAKKDQMMKEVYKRWQFDPCDDNEADAFSLAHFVWSAFCRFHELNALEEDCARVMLGGTPWLDRVLAQPGPLFSMKSADGLYVRRNLPPPDEVDYPLYQPAALTLRKSARRRKK